MSVLLQDHQNVFTWTTFSFFWSIAHFTFSSDQIRIRWIRAWCQLSNMSLSSTLLSPCLSSQFHLVRHRKKKHIKARAIHIYSKWNSFTSHVIFLELKWSGRVEKTKFRTTMWRAFMLLMVTWFFCCVCWVLFCAMPLCWKRLTIEWNEQTTHNRRHRQKNRIMQTQRLPRRAWCVKKVCSVSRHIPSTLNAMCHMCIVWWGLGGPFKQWYNNETEMGRYRAVELNRMVIWAARCLLDLLNRNWLTKTDCEH